MKLYDTYTKQLVDPNADGVIAMYCCGVTVYDYCHLGHARSYIVWDVLRRWCDYNKHALFHVQNFTDVDDKIIAKAIREGSTPSEVSTRFIAEYHTDMDWLNVQRAHRYPTVMANMIRMWRAAQRLLAKGYAYETNGDIRFRGSAYSNYGKLSGRTAEAEDFVVWKGPKDDEKHWFPDGRPGWHLECSVFCEGITQTVDIHCGGNDLIFPHHENEIAQSECLHGGAPLARIWLHNGLVTTMGYKMAKSDSNAQNIRQVRERGIDPNAVRLWVIQAGYSKPLALEPLMAGTPSEQWASLKETLRSAPDEGVSEAFAAAMDNDLNTPQALAALWAEPTKQMARILGFDLSEGEIPESVQSLSEQRTMHRNLGQYDRADEMKNAIVSQGFQVRDNPDGTTTILKG